MSKLLVTSSRPGVNDPFFVKPLRSRSSHFLLSFFSLKRSTFGVGDLIWFPVSGDWNMPAEGFERNLAQLGPQSQSMVGEPWDSLLPPTLHTSRTWDLGRSPLPWGQSPGLVFHGLPDLAPASYCYAPHRTSQLRSYAVHSGLTDKHPQHL